MRQRFKNSIPRHKSRIEQFWQKQSKMRKQNTNNMSRSYQSPGVRVNTIDQQQLLKTKTLKKHDYFGSQQIVKNREQQKDNVFSSLLGELASFVQEKNGEIPWTKRYDWEEMLVSNNDSSKKDREEKYMQMQKDVVQLRRVGQKQQQYEKREINRDENMSFNNNKCNWQQKCIQIQCEQQYSHTIVIPEKSNDEQYLQQSSDHNSSSESVVQFLLKMNKIASQTQTFERKCHHKKQEQRINNDKDKNNMNNKNNNNNNNKRKDNDDDSDDFEQLLALVERQQNRRSLKTQQQKYKIQCQQKAPIMQMIDSPIIRPQYKASLLDDLDDFDYESPFVLRNMHVYPKNNNQNNNNNNINNNNNQNKNNNQKHNNKNEQKPHPRSSQYKPCRLKKQRQQQATCTICMSQIQQRTRLPCRHQFCLQCIRDWLQKTSSCPICRKDAKYYLYQQQKYKVQQKKYSLQNFVDNVLSDDQDDDQQYSQDDVDYQCENCVETNIGDDIIVCDGCLVNASHVECDEGLGGVMPPDQMNWYCTVCRESTMLWFIESKRVRGDNRE